MKDVTVSPAITVGGKHYKNAKYAAKRWLDEAAGRILMNLKRRVGSPAHISNDRIARGWRWRWKVIKNKKHLHRVTKIMESLLK